MPFIELWLVDRNYLTALMYRSVPIARPNRQMRSALVIKLVEERKRSVTVGAASMDVRTFACCLQVTL